MKALAILLILCLVALTSAYYVDINQQEEEADAEFWGAVARVAAPHVVSWAANKLRRDAEAEELSDFIRILDGFRQARSMPQQMLFAREEQEEDAPASDSANTLCTTTGLNMRSTPCTNGRLIRTLSNGAQVTKIGGPVTQCGYTWVQVSAGGSTGWAAQNWLRSCGGSSTPRSPSSGGSSSGDISESQLRAVMPNLSSTKAREYLPYLNAAMREAQINTCNRKTAFLAQLAHESGELRWFQEFASGAAYEGRRDLGNTQPGDGKRFKGRGPIQLTGRANYERAGRALGLNLVGNPDQVATPQVGFRTAAWFWRNGNGDLNRYADGTQSGFDQITRRINGGYNGKADRDSKWRTARRVLGC